MANKKVEALIDAFRNHFRGDGQVSIPIALRQEPVDVVYRALIEEDKPDAPQLTPLITDPLAAPAEVGFDASMLAGLDMGMPDMGMDAPVAPQEAPGEPAEAGLVEDLLAGM